jgi:mannose-6-phosphate isomerase-like protein (cupin superfamily)
MSTYTLKNLKELENSAEQQGIEGLEARFARKDLDLEQFGFSYQKFDPSWRQPFGHRHRGQEELYLVLSGSGRVKVEDEIVDLKQWDALRIGPGVTRQFEAGPDGMEYLAIGGLPAGDADIIPNWWDG